MRLYEEQMISEIKASTAKARRTLSERRKALRTVIDARAEDNAFQAAYDAVKSAELDLQSSVDLWNMNELSDYGIDIPKEMYSGTERYLLTPVGSSWVKRQLYAKKRENIEFWFKLVVPVLALILSIIALVHKSH